MKKYFLSDSSTISLLISNIIVIILAIVGRWDTSIVLWVYWMQCVIIGFFQFLRILSLKNFSTENFTINNNSVVPTFSTKIYTAFFFLFHYGFFHFIYAIFLFSFFTNHTLDFKHLFLGGLIFFINHTFSYFHNRIIDEQKTQNIGKLMFAPYARIIPMHLIIIFGVLVSDQIKLVFFLMLKTGVDIAAHIFKHRYADAKSS